MQNNKWAVAGVFALVAGAIVGLALWLAPGQSPAKPANQPLVAVPVSPSDTVTQAVPAAQQAAAAAPTQTSAPAGVKQPGGTTAAARVAAVDDPTTTEQPPAGNVLTTTGPSTIPLRPDQMMAWCYDPNGHVWFSGAGESCTEASPYFVEYR